MKRAEKNQELYIDWKVLIGDQKFNKNFNIFQIPGKF